jgi:hypothetical protein
VDENVLPQPIRRSNHLRDAVSARRRRVLTLFSPWQK